MFEATQEHRKGGDQKKSSDEGYIDSKELPRFLKNLSETQKAGTYNLINLLLRLFIDLAFQLLSSLTPSTLSTIQERLQPLLHRDFISKLPVELSLSILGFLDKDSLIQSESVNKYWHLLAKDMKLWKKLYKREGWNYNKELIKYYKSQYLTQKNLTSHSATPQIKSPITSLRMGRTNSDNQLSPHKLRKQILYKQIHQNNLRSLPSTPLTQITFLAEEPRSEGESIPMSVSSSKMTRSHNVSIAEDQLTNELMSLNLGTQGQPISSTPVRDIYVPMITIDNVLNQETQQEARLRHRPVALNLTQNLSIGNIESPLNTGFMSNVSIEEIFSPFLDSPMNNNLESPINSPISTEDKRVSLPLRILNPENVDSYNQKSQADKAYHNTIQRNQDEIRKFHMWEINWKRLYNMKKKLESNWSDYKFDTQTLRGHSEGIYCLQLDSQTLFTGSRDNTIKVWDLTTNLCKRTFVGHEASVLCLQYDDRVLITGSSDSTILVWDLQTGEIIYKLEEHMDSVLNLTFNDTHLITCSKDRTIKVWERGPKQYKLLRTLHGHRVAVNSVQFRNDFIVSASGDRTLKIWSLSTGKCLNTLQGHSRGIASLSLYEDKIISGSSDKTIKIWDLKTGLCIRTLEGHDDLVRTLTVKDGVIISGSYDRSVRFWDLNSGVCLMIINDHNHRVFKVALSDTKIVSCSQDPDLLVWDFAADLQSLFII